MKVSEVVEVWNCEALLDDVVVVGRKNDEVMRAGRSWRVICFRV